MTLQPVTAWATADENGDVPDSTATIPPGQEGGRAALAIDQVIGLADALAAAGGVGGTLSSALIANSEGKQVRAGGLPGNEGSFAGLWMGQLDPDTLNYAILSNGGQTFFNTPAGDVGYMRVGNVDLLRFGDFSTLYPGLLDPLVFDIVQRAYITAASDNWAGLVVENDGTGAILDLRNASQATICEFLQDGTFVGVNATFGESVGDKVSLYGDMLGVAMGYCYGLEANFSYHRASTGHRWYIATLADGGTSAYLELTAAGLQIRAGVLNIKTPKTPASASATGTQGDICWDANYIYWCVATDTWVRAAGATW